MRIDDWRSGSVLLVCGSRSLEPDPQTPPGSPFWKRKAEAFELLTVEMREWLKAPGKHLVIHGGARGPDTWSQKLVELARKKPAWAERLHWASFCPDGWRHTSAGASERWSPKGVDPLQRNDFMLRFLEASVALGATVMALGVRDFTCPARRGGTGYTIAKAATMGIKTRLVEA